MLAPVGEREEWAMNRLNVAGGTACALIAMVAAACSSGSDSSTPTPTAAATTVASATSTEVSASAIVTSTRTAVTATATPSGASSAPAAAGKVSANNATVAELTAAFQAAGIANAARWATEVDEYRPYPATDANLPKLRQNLVKYNPGPGVVDSIVAALSLP
jgi:hypothetical protein